MTFAKVQNFSSKKKNIIWACNDCLSVCLSVPEKWQNGVEPGQYFKSNTQLPKQKFGKPDACSHSSFDNLILLTISMYFFKNEMTITLRLRFRANYRKYCNILFLIAFQRHPEKHCNHRYLTSYRYLWAIYDCKKNPATPIWQEKSL